MSAPSRPVPEPARIDPLGADRRVLERARASRDPRFDGRFFVGVLSTGIYCRSVCPAPIARAANVRYFATAAAAAEAGFRPCRRCRPEAAPGTPAWLGSSATVRRALRLIEAGALDERSVEWLAARVGSGSRHLHRLFVRHLGASPVQIAATRRLQFAKQLLDETDLALTQVAFEAGFGSVRRFNDAVRRAYDRSPRELRRARQAVEGQSPECLRLRFAYRPPYDWKAVLGFLAACAIAGVEQVDDLGYSRVITLPDARAPASVRAAIVRVRPVPGRHELELSVFGAPTGALLAICAAARRAFDLAADPVTIREALQADPLLGRRVRARPGLRIAGVWDPFECAVRAVLGQQISVAAARTLAARLVARVSPPLRTGLPAPRLGGLALEYAFPTPQRLAYADLSGLGITRARMATLQSLARAVLDGTLDFTALPEIVIRTLECLPGIGAWTAQYIALRALAEPDAFPTADVVLRRRAAPDDNPLTTNALATRAATWRPWRSYAAIHLWQAAHDAALRRRTPR